MQLNATLPLASSLRVSGVRRLRARLPRGPASSVLLGVLIAAVLTPSILVVERWLGSRNARTAAVDLTLLQFFGPDFELRRSGSFRTEDVELITSPGERYGTYLRITYPEGSSSPSSARADGTPMGGVQFYLRSREALGEQAHLRYFVRLSPDFEFARGGKLPGLFGGAGSASTATTDAAAPLGLSTRFGWSEDGQGEVYTYASAAGVTAQGLGRGAWTWPVGRWTCIEQQVVLGESGRADGELRVWMDDALVWEGTGLDLREGGLGLEGIFFSTFFGGSDATWASPRTQWADFAGVEVDDDKVGCSAR